MVPASTYLVSINPVHSKYLVFEWASAYSLRLVRDTLRNCHILVFRPWRIRWRSTIKVLSPH